MIPAAKAYVFDMDGTLLLLPVDWPEVRKLLEAVMNGPLDMSTTIFVTLERFLATRPEMKGELLGILDRYELAAAPKTQLFEGSREVLELLGRRGRLALVTMQGRKTCDALMRHLDLEGCFSVCLTREDSMDREEQLRSAMRALGVGADETVFVADRRNDMEAAKAAGVRFILLSGRLDSMKAVSYSDMGAFLDALRSDEAVEPI